MYLTVSFNLLIRGSANISVGCGMKTNSIWSAARDSLDPAESGEPGLSSDTEGGLVLEELGADVGGKTAEDPV